MIKTLKTMSKQDKERYTVPRKVQDVIPVRRIWQDGIFLTGNKFSKTYQFSDINYLVASREDKESMFLIYSELLNSLDSGAVTKITINNRRTNKANFENSILMPMQEDFRDEYRREYNQMLLDKATGANGITQEKYITISVVKKDIEEARAYFSRVGADLISHFAALGSKCVELDASERLRILHDFYRQGEEAEFSFDLAAMAKRGHDFKDYICPDSMEKNSDYVKLGDKFCRVLFLKDFASYIKDNMVTELTDFNRNLMFSIDVVPVPTDEAVREVENRLLGVETNITNWQRRQNANNNFSAVVPYDMELQRKESKEFLDDLTTRDQRMMFAVITLAITADTKEQLDSDTEAVLSVARKHMCQLAVLKFQQLDGLNTALPIGVRKINAFRTLIAAVKAIIAATKALIAAIAAGGWVAVLVIIVICLIGMIIGSCFGIFFSGEDSGTGQTMQTAVQEINAEYEEKLEEIKTSHTYDVLEMSGSRAVWKEVLAVYAVKTTTDPDAAQEVATMDDSKKQLLKDIFWQMNEISSSTSTKTETIIETSDDGHGNIVETEVTVTRTYLYITVSHKTAEEMANQFSFHEDQREQMAELLADENSSLWSQVLYGITGGDGEIVTVALSQVGNTGGAPYWSWYGFDSRVEWCACFVSWCANECGYIDAGVIPKFAACASQGVPWFKERGLWQDNSYEPRPGDIIFFDWDDGGQDGSSDHVGIVEKVENGRVYTVEGNSGDSVRQNSYPVGYYEIYGYGTPAY